MFILFLLIEPYFFILQSDTVKYFCQVKNYLCLNFFLIYVFK